MPSNRMTFFGILCFLFLYLAREAESIRCSSCLLLTSNNKDIQNAMASAFSRVFNSKCADDNAAGVNEIQCPGSCEHVSSNVGLQRDGGPPITLTLHMRRCNALQSLDVGCQALTMEEDEKKVQGYLGAILGTVPRFTSVQGRYCLCNSDGCNANTRNLPVMAPVPVTQCYKCQWRQFRSSDPAMEQMLNAGVANQIQASCKNSQYAPMISCRGSCGITNSTVYMSSRNGRFMQVETIERDCVSVRTTSQCVDGTPVDKDGNLFQQLQQHTGFQNIKVQNQACTCSGNGCNGEGTESLVSSTKTREVPIRYTPVRGSGNRSPGGPGPQPPVNPGIQSVNRPAGRPPMYGPAVRPPVYAGGPPVYGPAGNVNPPVYAGRPQTHGPAGRPPMNAGNLPVY
ncbi:uncharacterized protein LOC106179475 [Lingula anatina]|uniref:Uncharacterized protein LOC106179475 n=1 Tax=Lingula anatina TaxID=7574 RepID=A0A1S3K8I4_LINAN|nr:uncharacterized protein LOC106179475 [Lingula anatina]|eukprot:XP_013418566.1 uncharacterized protein LOC106179475 [Lingula anatina]